MYVAEGTGLGYHHSTLIHLDFSTEKVMCTESPKILKLNMYTTGQYLTM